MSRSHERSAVAILRIEGIPAGTRAGELGLLRSKLCKVIAAQEPDLEASDVHVLVPVDQLSESIIAKLERRSLHLTHRHAETTKDRQHLASLITDLLRDFARRNLAGGERMEILPFIEPHSQLEHYSSHGSSH